MSERFYMIMSIIMAAGLLIGYIKEHAHGHDPA
jgi:hypothetical protein